MMNRRCAEVLLDRRDNLGRLGVMHALTSGIATTSSTLRNDDFQIMRSFNCFKCIIGQTAMPKSSLLAQNIRSNPSLDASLILASV